MWKNTTVLLFFAFVSVAPLNVELAMKTLVNTVKMFYLGTVDGKSFFTDHSLMTWNSSREFCKKSGMELATIKSHAQHNLLSAAYDESNFEGSFWINARDAISVSQFAWDPDNTPLDPSFVRLLWKEEPFIKNCLSFFISGINQTLFLVKECNREYETTKVLCEVNHGRDNIGILKLSGDE